MNRVISISCIMVVLSGYATAQQKSTVTDKIYSLNDVDKQPEYPGGDDSLAIFVNRNIYIPDEIKRDTGTLYAKFIIDKNGTLDDIEIQDDIGFGIDKILISALKKTATWLPALVNGNPVKCEFEISVGVGIDTIKNTGEIKLEAFTFVERMPVYPHGNNALIDFLSKNVKYPKEARKKGTHGKVVVTFVVDENGIITDVKLLNDIGDGCGDEAIRIIKLMPQWTPGRQNGNFVKVQFSIPIQFQL